MGRVSGWEARLVEVLRRASVERFDPLRWNCARFAHAAAEAVTGRQVPYALRKTLEGSVDALFQRVPVRWARRGDIVLADVPEPCLGVCLGARAAFLRADGLLEVPMARVRVAWGVR